MWILPYNHNNYKSSWENAWSLRPPAQVLITNQHRLSNRRIALKDRNQSALPFGSNSKFYNRVQRFRQSQAIFFVFITRAFKSVYLCSIGVIYTWTMWVDANHRSFTPNVGEVKHQVSLYGNDMILFMGIRFYQNMKIDMTNVGNCDNQRGRKLLSNVSFLILRCLFTSCA